MLYKSTTKVIIYMYDLVVFVDLVFETATNHKTSNPRNLAILYTCYLINIFEIVFRSFLSHLILSTRSSDSSVLSTP